MCLASLAYGVFFFGERSSAQSIRIRDVLCSQYRDVERAVLLGHQWPRLRQQWPLAKEYPPRKREVKKKRIS